MYKCEVCNKDSKPGEVTKKHNIYREVVRGAEKTIRKEIARELKVCETCLVELSAGLPISWLKKRHAQKDVPPPEPSFNKPVRLGRVKTPTSEGSSEVPESTTTQPSV